MTPQPKNPAQIEAEKKAKAAKEIERRRARNVLIRRGGAEGFLLYIETIFKFYYKKPFRRTWWDGMLAQALMDIYDGVTDRLLISMPPRHGKTERAVRLFGSYVQGLDMQIKLQYATYSGTLSTLTSIDTKDIMESAIYGEIFPDVAFNPKLNLKDHWKLKAGAEFLGTSVGGSNTGIGAEIFIGDDLLKAADADSKARRDEAYSFYDSSALTRLEGRKAVIFIMQRLHEDDPAGRVLAKGGRADSGGVWEVIELPVINEEPATYHYRDMTVHRPAHTPLDPEKFGLEFIRRQQLEMSKVEFKRQYMQDAEVSEAGHFKREDFTYVTDAQLPQMYLYIMVDQAESEESTADDRGIVCVGKSVDETEVVTTTVLDGWFGKEDVYGVVEQLIAKMLKFPDARVLIEGAGGGITLHKVLKREMLVYNAKAQAEGRAQVMNGVMVFKPDNKVSKNEVIKLMTNPLEQHVLNFYKFMDGAFQDQLEKEFLKFNPERKGNTDNLIDPLSKSFVRVECVAKRKAVDKPKPIKRHGKRGQSQTWRGV